VDDGRTKEMRQVGKSAGTAAAATKGVDASRTGVAGRQVEPNGTQAVKADSATAAGGGSTKLATTTSADKKLPVPSAGTSHVDATKRGPARDGMGAGIGLGAVVAVAGGAGAATLAAGVGAEADEAGKKDVNEPAQVVVVPPSGGTTERVPQEVPPIEEVSVFLIIHAKLGLALTKLSIDLLSSDRGPYVRCRSTTWIRRSPPRISQQCRSNLFIPHVLHRDLYRPVDRHRRSG
jgi:hypothetical protein